MASRGKVAPRDLVRESESDNNDSADSSADESDSPSRQVGDKAKGGHFAGQDRCAEMADHARGSAADYDDLLGWIPPVGG